MKYLGSTDDVTTCDCCGRRNLKSTVVLELDDASEPVHFGVTCAARALRVSARDVRAGARRADDERREAEARARRERERLEYDADQAVLDAWYPTFRGNRFEQVRMLFAEGRSLEDLRTPRTNVAVASTPVTKRASVSRGL